MSGEFVWECDDLDDTSTQLLTTPSILSSPVPLPVTLWNQSGIYVLQVHIMSTLSFCVCQISIHYFIIELQYNHVLTL